MLYLDQEQIQSTQDVDVVESSMVQAVEVLRQLPIQSCDRFMEIHRPDAVSFDVAAEEEVDRQDMMERVAPAVVAIRISLQILISLQPRNSDRKEGKWKHRRESMKRSCYVTILLFISAKMSNMVATMW
jgi:hypothetical protein